MNSNGNEWWKNVSDKGQSAKANVSGFFKKIKMFENDKNSTDKEFT